MVENVYLPELRLFLEELCCELCRFRHMQEDGLAPEEITIEREWPLGPTGAFADIYVAPDGLPSYFVEVKYGISIDETLDRIAYKYGPQSAGACTGARLILVVAREDAADRNALRAAFQSRVDHGLVVEVWDDDIFRGLCQRYFGVQIPGITEESLRDVREAVQGRQGMHAFGGTTFDDPQHDALRKDLLWRFSFWRLRQIREAHNLTPRTILPPGLYRGVAVVIADMCSFSSFVRDTPDDQVLRHSLSAFYSKARDEVINRGGMLENFVGDQILALFGVPDRQPGYIEHALLAAKGLIQIGAAVGDDWQRKIDRVQPSVGMHVGIAYGDLQIVPLRPSSRRHMTAIADVINVGARLMNIAGSGEVVMSNSFFHRLPASTRIGFTPLDPLDGRNVGRILAWMFRP